MILRVERLRAVRQRPGEVHAELFTAGAALPSPARLSDPVIQPLYRQRSVRDEDGNLLRVERDRVKDVDQDGELRPAVATIFAVDRAVALEDLTLDDAKACGFKTVQGLRSAWLETHPRSPVVNVVWYALGDQRDRPLFLNWTGRAGGDYVRSLSRAADDAEALTPEQMAALATGNRQKDEARRAKASQALKSENLIQRVKRLETVAERYGEDAARALRPRLRPHFRVIDQRLKRVEKKKK